MYRIIPAVMSYDWGSHGEVEKYFGIPNPPGKALAELWFGAHRKAPARIADEGEFSLRDLLVSHGEDILGKELYRRFGGEFPFLLKILSAGKGLSIQAHPSKVQAEEGFSREEEQGIDIDAPERNYRDDNHKPECIVAVSEFWALSGFRPPEEILTNLRRLEAAGCQAELISKLAAILEDATGENTLRDFYTALMNADREDVKTLLEQSQKAARHYISGTDRNNLDQQDQRIWYWVLELESQFPGDPGTLAPLYLNIIKLNPGEGLFMHAGILHAYLRGTGIELMANSDNVLRGGCTSKHVDVPELISVLNFTPFYPDTLTPDSHGWYKSPVPEFRIARVRIHSGEGEAELRREMDLGTAPAILLAEESPLRVEHGEEILTLSRGEAVFIPAERQSDGDITPIAVKAEGDSAAFALASVNSGEEA